MRIFPSFTIPNGPNFLIWVHIVSLQLLGNFQGQPCRNLAFLAKKHPKNGHFGAQNESNMTKRRSRFKGLLEKYLEFLQFEKSSEISETSSIR